MTLFQVMIFEMTPKAEARKEKQVSLYTVYENAPQSK